LFDAPLQRARFVQRPNRFIVRARLASGEEVRAFMPNPGRLHELLLPGVALTLAGPSQAPARATRYTVVAVEREGDPVFLHTTTNNRVAHALIDGGTVPGLTAWRVARTEVTVGRSRFDFLLRSGRRERLCEVKSVTLFGNGVAMFPDAVTERGRRHVEELAALGGDALPVVLFLVHSPRPRLFMPDYHTDLAFSRTLVALRRCLAVLPVALRWRGDAALPEVAGRLRVPWRFLEREAVDAGACLFHLRLDDAATLDDSTVWPAGHYLWHMPHGAGLGPRIASVLRRSRRAGGPLGLLRRAAAAINALPVRSSRPMDDALARALATRYARLDGVPAYRCDTAPLTDEAFHRQVLEPFRMRHP
jgi:sugar fermentation stimulation protein A